jgi:DinB superfamily
VAGSTVPGPGSHGAALAGRVRVAVDAILALGPAIAATPPLGESAKLGDGEDTWGPREVLAHVTEATAYWHGEIERILAGDLEGPGEPGGPGDPAAPVPFGRTPNDVARVAILARDRTLPATVLLARLSRDGAMLTDRIATLSDAELDRAGLHPTRGPMTVASVIETTLASHFEGHAAQIRAAVGSA